MRSAAGTSLGAAGLAAQERAARGLGSRGATSQSGNSPLVELLVAAKLATRIDVTGNGGEGAMLPPAPKARLTQQLRPALPRVAALLALTDRIVEKHAAAARSADGKQKWLTNDFKPLCETAIATNAELAAAIALSGVAHSATAVDGTDLLEAVANHVCRATGEALSRLVFIARMVKKAAPSTHATHGTPNESLAGTPASTMPAAVAGSKRARDAFPEVPPLRQQPRGAAASKPSSPSMPPPAPSRQPSRLALDASSPSPPPVSGGAAEQQQRPMSKEKLHLLMPWTIPPPSSVGVMLRRATPTTLGEPTPAVEAAAVAYLAKARGIPKASVDAKGECVPTMLELCGAAAQPAVYALWRRRQRAMGLDPNALVDGDAGSDPVAPPALPPAPATPLLAADLSTDDVVADAMSAQRTRTTTPPPAATAALVFPHATAQTTGKPAAQPAMPPETSGTVAGSQASPRISGALSGGSSHMVVPRSVLAQLTHCGVLSIKPGTGFFM